MNYYRTSEARKHFSEIINKVYFEKIIVSIGRRDKEEVLIVPKPEFDQSLPISQINAASSSFDFLKNEPDLYHLKDLKKRYV